VNGVPVKHAEVAGKGGWTFEGNTLTTVIPVVSRSTAERATVEVRRAAGLTARRGELDGFAGTMTRLRGAYDATNALWPVVGPPDLLVDAMQAGDRLGYHPDRAVQEIAHLHEILPKAQAAIAGIDSGFAARLDAYIARQKTREQDVPVDYEAEAKRRLDAVAKAHMQVDEAGK
jgi:alpha-glucosidase